ncbi:hypothetical protein KSS93_15535 [Pseudomonas xanthosomatis]|uniref:hypothetical protein n=1 Tax=Pseudomonas xanthosomatis TaxID=2842356 RepID=UPI001C3E860B|nr:hypothetical protein [Pseudomonas xanthosomatis]QXH44304.1 hypothetical protein KSS93_15535 [Pseudomonas xanthosomatis]
MYRLIKPALLAIAVGLLAGCAHDPDIRAGHDNTYGTTAKSPDAYLGCVKGELPASAQTYRVQGQYGPELLVTSTDPNKADGLVQLSGSRYMAYQRDAWYDHGRLLDAALMCSRT